MLRSTVDSKIKNAGFSLVELIVCVAILAIAAIPLMKSLGMASRTNAKAQSIQNANSLAESVMEEIKGTSIADLSAAGSGWTFVDHTTWYELKKANVTATQGEKFDVEVKIDKAAYSTPIPTSAPTKKDKVLGANVIKLPKLEEIDTVSQAVLSSDKELNKYDMAAQNYFNQQLAVYPPPDPADIPRIEKKTINIVKAALTSVGGAVYNGVTVTATVTYEDDSGNEFTKDLYTGSFVEDGNPIDSNIYIFYRDPSSNSVDAPIDKVIIKIDDVSTYGEIGNTWRSHKVYFVRQNTASVIPDLLFDGIDTHLISEAPTNTLSTLDDNGCREFDKTKLITNIDKTNTSVDGHIYESEAKTRVYNITVVLKKAGETEEYAKITSTANASE